MTTALSIVTDALKEICVLAEGDTPTASMSNDALRQLNRFCDLISNEQSFAYYPSLSQRTLTGESSFTIGPTGDVVVARPIKIETAFLDRQGITYPVRVVDNQIFDSIVYKGATGANTAYLWYEATEPNGIVHLWPLCSGVTLNLRTINQVANFAALNTDLTLPPGYEEALVKNLAVMIAPQYPAGVLSPLTVKAAKNAMRIIQRTNNVIPTLLLPSAVSTRSGGYSLANFLSGGY